MKRLFLVCLALSLLVPSLALASLESFLANVNVEARADMPGFSVRVSNQFGIPVPQVQAVIRAVPEPADAFMIFQLGEMSGRHPEEVMEVYRPNKGWGAVAKELGIKPGSAEFHALKRGDLHFTGSPSGHGGDKGGKGKGKGKGQGHGKGHNK